MARTSLALDLHVLHNKRKKSKIGSLLNYVKKIVCKDQRKSLSEKLGRGTRKKKMCLFPGGRGEGGQ